MHCSGCSGCAALGCIMYHGIRRAERSGDTYPRSTRLFDVRGHQPPTWKWRTQHTHDLSHGRRSTIIARARIVLKIDGIQLHRPSTAPANRACCNKYCSETDTHQAGAWALQLAHTRRQQQQRPLWSLCARSFAMSIDTECP
ncbi:unnamed protein product [Ectocarpus sp. 8 AP-2014]